MHYLDTENAQSLALKRTDKEMVAEKRETYISSKMYREYTRRILHTVYSILYNV